MSTIQDMYDGWVDLHCHSAYSPLDGVPFPDDIVSKAASLGRTAVALTDHGSVSGHVLFEKAIEGFTQKSIGANTMFRRDGTKLAIKPIYGVEAYTARSVAEDAREQRKNHLTILARNPTGYKNMIQLVSESYERGFYYRPTVDGEMLERHRDGLVVLSGCESSAFARAVASGDLDGAYRKALAVRKQFGSNYYIEIQHFPHQRELTLNAFAIATAANIKTVLTCDVHYLEPDDKYEQQLLVSIRDRTPVSELDWCMHHAHPWEPDALLAHCYANVPELPWEWIMFNTAEVAASIEDFRIPKAPHVLYPFDGDKISYMRQVCIDFLRGKGLDQNQSYIDRLNRELQVIGDKEYQDYFLVVADMIRWAKSQGIYVGPARGSAAGSLVCWGLRITEIDPLQWGLLFERFVDPTRVDLPDIDVDFEDERRMEVVQYLRDKYGAENVANIATFARFGGRSTLDDVARSYRIPDWAISVVKRHLVDRSSGDQRAEFTIQDALAEPEVQRVWEQFPALEYATKIQGKVRNTGKHAAGVVVTSEPVTNFMAVYRQNGQGEPILGVDWRDAAYLNLMKIDVLGLKELTIIRMIAERIGMTLDDVYALPLDDPAAIDLFNRRDYLGIFQFEGLAVRSVAERIKFDSLREIADVNALARPGPLHAGATEAYIIGRAADNFMPVIEHPDVQPIIADTYGQIIYQETIMRILREIGGMDWQDVCDIRNIMGKSKGSEAFDSYWPIWRRGTVEAGKMDEPNARHIWECIRLYGKHSFNASHAFAYGLLAYWSAYFKAHYPREYYWAQLVKTGGKEDDQRFIYEALQRGITFAPVNWGMKTPGWDIGDDGSIVPGWTIIPGIGPAIATRWCANAPYAHEEDFRARSGYKGVFLNRRMNKSGQEIPALADYMGKTVSDMYGLSIWAELAQVHPQRIPIQTIKPGDDCIVVGRVIKLNKKSRKEEWKSKGKDISTLDLTKPDEYVIITLEDETGSMMVYVSPTLYKDCKDFIWNNPNGLMMVSGTRTSDIPLIMARKVYSVTLTQEGIAA